MPVISYTDFSGGLDRRLPINVQESSRLWTLTNAYITTGKKIRKRPAIIPIVDGLSGSFGLEASNGVLQVFTELGSGFLPPGAPPMQVVTLNSPPTAGSGLTGIASADLFSGFWFVVGYYGTQTFHHYVDGATTYITDVNCPNSAGVAKAASRIFAPDAENIAYCAAGDPRDWTTASDAGFLPAGLQQDTNDHVTACGTFQDALVGFFPESAQVWDVAVDPSANKIRKRLYGVGTTEPLSLAGFAGDLMFQSPFGFRSMVVQQTSDRIDDTDTGVPIDTLVVDDLAYLIAPVRSLWIPQLGQYWAIFQMSSGCKAWVYTYSKSSKIGCWSEYTLPNYITDIATLNGKVYARSADQLFEVSSTAYLDLTLVPGGGGGQVASPISVEAQMAFQDAKTPGVDKQFYGADFALKGSPDISYLYDPRDLAKETTPYTLTSDTRPDDLAPIEVVSPAIAPVFRHEADEEFEVDAVQLYYELLRS